MEKQMRSFTFITVLYVTLWVTAVFSIEPPKIEPSARKFLVPEGNMTKLDCYITVPNVLSHSILSWEGPVNGGKFTTNTETVNVLTYHRYLTIESFTDNHEGKYTCKYKYGNEQMETSIELFTVMESKSELEFYYGNKTAILECTLDFKNPDYQVEFQEWLKDNVSILELKHPERFIDHENGTLVNTDPDRTDAGLYSAKYEVVIGNDVFKYDCLVPYTAAPLVLDMSKSHNVEEGDTLTLECKVKGYPPANVTWLKDNETLVLDRVHVFMDPFDNTLSVHSVATSDAGVYTCVAVDRNGRRSSKRIVVRVKDPLEWLWPVIGILCQVIVLAGIIFTCSKIKKDDHVEKPADEREGLLRQGSGRVREQDKND